MKHSIKPIPKTTSKKNEFSFPKSSRFPRAKENHDPSLLLLPSTLSRKSCTFGLGRRKPLISKHCQASPSPESYFSQSSFNNSNHCRDYSLETVKERELFYIKPVPGPGAYNPSTPKRRRVQNCLISKTKNLASHSMTPTPCSYRPNYEFCTKNIAFGISFTKTRKISYVDERTGEVHRKKLRNFRRARSLDAKAISRIF
jgi:hypothetical protein